VSEELSLGEIVRDCRKDLGLTQAALGEAIGTYQAVVSQIEIGKLVAPKPELLEALETALLLPPGRLAGFGRMQIRGGTADERLEHIDAVIDAQHGRVERAMLLVEAREELWRSRA
jgi:transcriptional regulator with XRE-family HTH domain